MQNFSKTLHEEVFNPRVGVNPPLIVKPEELPIISEVIGEGAEQIVEAVSSPSVPFSTNPKSRHEITESDEEVLPANYLFSGE